MPNSKGQTEKMPDAILSTTNTIGCSTKEVNIVDTASQVDTHCYIKHPVDIPIWVRPLAHLEQKLEQKPLTMLSHSSSGSLAFENPKPLRIGSQVELTIRITHPIFNATGVIMWCRNVGKAWEMGVQFIHEEDAFRARMVEQICHIEQYRRDIARQEGRYVSSEVAAREWIQKHAAQFPNPFIPVNAIGNVQRINNTSQHVAPRITVVPFDLRSSNYSPRHRSP
ncbi:MAG: PilZ domain-containing protein [Gammaproteobacteria bacterium]